LPFPFWYNPHFIRVAEERRSPTPPHPHPLPSARPAARLHPPTSSTQKEHERRRDEKRAFASRPSFCDVKKKPMCCVLCELFFCTVNVNEMKRIKNHNNKR
jgi:hypothetical protein